MPATVKANETDDLVDVALLGSDAVMAHANSLANLLEERRLPFFRIAHGWSVEARLIVFQGAIPRVQANVLNHVCITHISP
jgi:hypothetical protein